jgi:hypothetical protein
VQPLRGEPEDEDGQRLVDGRTEVPLAGGVQAEDPAGLVDGQQGLPVQLLAERGEPGAERPAEVGQGARLVQPAARVEQERRRCERPAGAGQVERQPAELGPRLDGGREDGVRRVQRAAVLGEDVRPGLGLADLPAAGVPARLLEGGGDVGGEARLGAYGGRVQGLLRGSGTGWGGVSAPAARRRRSPR